MNLIFASDEVVWASWRFSTEEKVPCPKHTNEAIEAYVTAGARIHLLKIVQKDGTVSSLENSPLLDSEHEKQETDAYVKRNLQSTKKNHDCNKIDKF
jgi:hypothetical protein